MIQSVNRAQILAKASKMKPPKPKFQFGKYKGKTVEFVERNDPEYIIWCWRNVAKCYMPFGKEVYERCYEFVKDQEHEGDLDDFDVMDMPGD